MVDLCFLLLVSGCWLVAVVVVAVGVVVLSSFSWLAFMTASNCYLTFALASKYSFKFLKNEHAGALLFLQNTAQVALARDIANIA